MTPEQQNAIFSGARDVADVMLQLNTLCSSFDAVWIAGGLSAGDFSELSGTNAGIGATNLPTLVTAMRGYVQWFDANADTVAVEFSRFGVREDG